ncbi:protein of unknown function [Petrocella atlantisensis]|uniref:Uncharacterized protein n=1 Tax=Petrocella atlantisensis TaxID=2173034 RepID=A0A3P7Q065_9FIRM|nr:protein of unknown function [Petrocella atlantisensis]
MPFFVHKIATIRNVNTSKKYVNFAIDLCVKNDMMDKCITLTSTVKRAIIWGKS